MHHNSNISNTEQRNAAIKPQTHQTYLLLALKKQMSFSNLSVFPGPHHLLFMTAISQNKTVESQNPQRQSFTALLYQWLKKAILTSSTLQQSEFTSRWKWFSALYWRHEPTLHFTLYLFQISWLIQLIFCGLELIRGKTSKSSQIESFVSPEHGQECS